MSILVDENTKLIVQGITGRDGKFHAEQMINYGTKIVAGVTPGKGGHDILGCPVFNSMRHAMAQVEANASIIYVPAPFAADAIIEAAEAGVSLIVCITEGVPVLDVARALRVVQFHGARLIGPNCPGVISPGKTKLGIMPGHIHKPGSVGVVSRSGTLTYEVVDSLTRAGIGQSSCLGIGGDPLIGTSFHDALVLFEQDSDTKAIAMIGEIGGSAEEDAAQYISEHGTKPVVSFIAGRTAPKGRQMGHAGAIVSGSSGSSESKLKALRGAGVVVVDNPEDVASAIQKAIV